MGGPGVIDGKIVDEFVVDGVEYYSAENYFQCQKCTNDKDREYLRHAGCGADVWSASRNVTLRSDWEKVKVRVMYTGNKAKFEQNEDLKEALLKTKGKVSFDNSTRFWCKWNAKIIELVREELRPEGERDEKLISSLLQDISAYEDQN